MYPQNEAQVIPTAPACHENPSQTHPSCRRMGWDHVLTLPCNRSLTRGSLTTTTYKNRTDCCSALLCCSQLQRIPSNPTAIDINIATTRTKKRLNRTTLKLPSRLPNHELQERSRRVHHDASAPVFGRGKQRRGWFFPLPDTETVSTISQQQQLLM